MKCTQQYRLSRKNTGRFIVGSGISAYLLFFYLIVCCPPFAYCIDLESDGSLAVSGEEFIGHMYGNMGFERDPGSTGTLNDLRHDLGLPLDNQTLGVEVSYRPLEHHMLRMYGSIPERYTGENVLTRDLILRNQTIVSGTPVRSSMHVAQFGLGYDLDLILDRRFQGGANMDVRYLNYYVNLSALNSGNEHTLALDEVVPCIGGHAKTTFQPTLIPWPSALVIGGYGRLTYGINPNYLNLFELKLGVVLSAVTPFGGALDFKFGYKSEGWNQINVAGRDLDFKRDGIFVSLAGAF